MVYIVVEVIINNGIYNDGVKVGVTTSVPHSLTLLNGL
jgi:hypothetical protein